MSAEQHSLCECGPLLVRGAQFVEAYAGLTADPAAFAWLDEVANATGSSIPIDNDGERAFIEEALRQGRPL